MVEKLLENLEIIRNSLSFIVSKYRAEQNIGFLDFVVIKPLQLFIFDIFQESNEFLLSSFEHSQLTVYLTPMEGHQSILTELTYLLFEDVSFNLTMDIKNIVL